MSGLSLDTWQGKLFYYLVVISVISLLFYAALASQFGAASIGLPFLAQSSTLLGVVFGSVAYGLFLAWRRSVRGLRRSFGGLPEGSQPPTLSGGIMRELGFKESFVLSFQLYKRNFKTYLAVILLAAGTYGLVGLAMEQFLPVPTQSPTESTLAMFGFQITSLPESILTLLVSSPVNAITDGIGVMLTADLIRNGHASLRQGFKAATGRIQQLWLVVVLANLMTTIGYALFIIPGVILLIIFFVATAAVLLENKGAIDGLKRSRQLVSKRWERIFGFLLVLGLIVGIPGVAIYAFFPTQSLPYILGTSLVEGFFYPLSIILITFTYFSNAARLQDESQKSEQGIGPVQVRLWACRNCGTTFMAASRPNPMAFGGCPKAKKSLFTYPGKHDWAVSLPTDAQK